MYKWCVSVLVDVETYRVRVLLPNMYRYISASESVFNVHFVVE